MADISLVLAEEISPIVKKARALEVKDDKSMALAVDMLSTINRVLDRAKEDKEKITKPLNDTLKEVRLRYKPIEEPGTEAVSELRGKISAYQTQKKRDAEAEEAKLAARVGAGKGKLKMETAVAKMADIERPADSVSTDSGMVKFRTVTKFKVTEMRDVPLEFLEINETLVKEAMKNGVKIPGIEYFTEEIPVNSR